MGFNENAFMLWGTGIAIFGVAYTIWDSKKKEISNTYNKYIPNNNGAANNQIAPQTQPAVNNSDNIEPVTPQTAGSKRRKRKNKKTKKRRK